MNNKNNMPNYSLSKEERGRMRASLREYMAMKPLRGQAPARASVNIWSVQWFYSPRAIASALVVAFFASTAGVSFAAENALPGDALYGIKTHVNEPLKGAFAVSAKAKSQWAIDVASTRLQEAATLAAEGRLDASTQKTLKENFDEHAKEAAQLIAREASTSPDTGIGSAVSFDAQLSEYERVLTQVGHVNDVPTQALASAVQDIRAHVGAIRDDAQATIATAASASSSSEKLAASRMRDIARAQLEASLKLAHRDDGSLEESSARQVVAQLDSASNTISQGQQLLESDAHEAQGAFQDALTSAQKLEVFLKTSAAIHARTGMKIGEKSNGKNSNRGESEQPAAFAAPTAATAATEATSSATSTETNNEINVTTQPQISTHDGDRNRGDQNDDRKFLPLSVPTGFNH